MKPSITNFNKTKRALSQIEVRRGIVNFFPDGVYELPSEDPESMLVKDESIVFYGGDGNEIFIKSLFWPVIREVQENINHIDTKEPLKYLIEIIDFYASIEDNIKEDVQGNLKADFITFKDFSVRDLNKRDFGMYKSFLSSLNESVREALIELNSIYNRLHVKPLKGNDIKIKDISTKSFIINDKRILFSEEFETMFEELKQDYIRCDDIRNFRKIFKGESIFEKVIWKGKQGALKYFIKVLVEKEIIKCPQPIYITTAYCFKYETREVIHDKLSHDHVPKSNKRIADLDEILSNMTDWKISH